jgi:hypothetical protein
LLVGVPFSAAAQTAVVVALRRKILSAKVRMFVVVAMQAVTVLVVLAVATMAE